MVKSKIRESGVSRIGSPKLVDRRRAFLARPAGDEIEPVERREIEASADRRQRAEIRQLIELGIGVEREIAKRAEIAVAARDRQIEVDRGGAGGAAERAGVEVRRAAPAAVEMLRCSRRAGAWSRHCPRGSLNNVPLAVAGEVARGACFARAVVGEARVAIGPGEVAVPVGIADDVPVPLRLVPLSVTPGCALSCWCCGQAARAKCRRARSGCGPRYARASVFKVPETLPNTCAVDRGRAADVATSSNERARGERLVRRSLRGAARSMRMSRSSSVSMPLPSAWRLNWVRPLRWIISRVRSRIAAGIAALGRGVAVPSCATVERKRWRRTMFTTR